MSRLSMPGTCGLQLTRRETALGARAPNHRLERTVMGRCPRAASALRYLALASCRTRLRSAAQPYRQAAGGEV